MQIKQKRCKDGQKLALTGSLVIDELSEIHAEAVSFITDHDRVVLDLAAVDRLDVAGIQWLLAAVKLGERVGKPIRIEGLNAGHLAVAESTGITLTTPAFAGPASAPAAHK